MAVGVALEMTFVVSAPVGPHELLPMAEGVVSIVEHATRVVQKAGSV